MASKKGASPRQKGKCPSRLGKAAGTGGTRTSPKRSSGRMPPHQKRELSAVKGSGGRDVSSSVSGIVDLARDFVVVDFTPVLPRSLTNSSRLIPRNLTRRNG